MSTPTSDWLYIGESPPDEPCAQIGTKDYDLRARHECRAYIDQLRRHLGTEPDGASLRVRSNPHDFGSYLSVVCYYDSAIPESLAYALRCESEGPENWDDQARIELKAKGVISHE